MGGRFFGANGQRVHGFFGTRFGFGTCVGDLIFEDSALFVGKGLLHLQVLEKVGCAPSTPGKGDERRVIACIGRLQGRDVALTRVVSIN